MVYVRELWTSIESIRLNKETIDQIQEIWLQYIVNEFACNRFILLYIENNKIVNLLNIEIQQMKSVMKITMISENYI